MVMASPGGGFIFIYFHEETVFEDILQISHILCLAHLPAGHTHPGLAQPLFIIIASIYKDVERSSCPYLHQREQVGMFLRVRATCRFSLSYCSSWYQETVKDAVRTIIYLRESQNRLERQREALGCICKTCCIVWLERSWICPACVRLP